MLKLLKLEQTNLSLYANYRETKNTFSDNQKVIKF